MAEFEFDIGVEKSIKNLNELLAKFNELKTVVETVGKPNGESLKTYNTTLEKTVKTQDDLSRATGRLSDSYKIAVENNKKLGKEEDAKLSRSKKIVAQGNKEFAIVKQGTSAVKKQVEAVASLNKNLNKSRQASKKAFETSEIKKFKEAVDKLGKSEARVIDIKKRWAARAKKNRILAEKAIATTNKKTEADKRASRASKSLWTVTKRLFTLYSVFAAARILLKIGKEVFSLIKKFDSLRFTMEKVVGGAYDSGQAWDFLITSAKNFGAELLSLTKRYVKFFVAAKQSGLALRETQKIFKAFTKVSGVLGLETHEMEGIFLALEQMLSKGKITTEELRRQLGERLPGAMGIMATAVKDANGNLGVTVDQLDKMLKKGQVLSAEVLPRFADAVEVALGIESVKKVNTLVAAQNNLTTSWQLLVKEVSSGSGEIAKSISKAFGFFQKILDDAAFKAANSFGKVQISAREMADSVSKEFKDLALKNISIINPSVRKEIEDITFSLALAKKELDTLKTTDIGDSNKKAIADKNKEIDELTIKYISQQKLIQEEEVKVAEASKKRILKTFNEEKTAFDDLKKENESYLKDIEKGEDLRIKLIKDREEAETVSAKGLIAQKIIDNNEEIETSKMLSRLAEKSMKDRIKTYAKAIAELRKVQLLLSVSLDPKTSPKGTTTSEANRIRLASAIKVSEDVIKNDSDTLDEQTLLAKSNAAIRREIARLLYIDQVAAAEKSTEKIKKAQAVLNKNLIEAELKFENEIKDIDKNRIDRQKKEADEKKKDLEEELQNERGVFAEIALEEAKRFNNLSIKRQKDEKELAKHNAIIIAATIEHEKKMLAIRLASGIITKEEHAIALKNISDLENALEGLLIVLKGDSSFSKWVKDNIKGLKSLRDIMLSLSDVANAFSERKIQNIEKEQEASEKQFDQEKEQLEASTERSIEAVALSSLSAEEKAERAEGIRASADAQDKRLTIKKDKRDEEFRKKANKAKRKQAIIDKAAALITIAIDTAIAVSKAAVSTAGLPFPSNIVAFLASKTGIIISGAAQAAAVIATPLPAFAEGGVNKKTQKILINDHKSGRQEYINRSGEILTTNKKNAVIDSKAGDEIYKDANAMSEDLGYNLMLGSVKQSLRGGVNLFNPSSLIKIQTPDNSSLEKVISKGISKGFKSVSNTTNIHINSEYHNYITSKQL